MEPRPICELTRITKSYPGVQALKDVDLTLRPGSIHALLGENGAGKSTLINILSGGTSPDAGVIRLDGQPVHFPNVLAARRAGIVTVHQEVDLFTDLTVAENLGLLTGLPVNRLGWVNWGEQNRRTRAALAAVGEAMSPRAQAAELSPAGRQMIEIAAAVSQSARVLVLDEPTSSLSAAEVQILFGHLRRIGERGAAILYVSHRLEEIFTLADEVTVLRDGRRVWQGLIADTSTGDLIQKMVGRELSAPSLKTEREKGAAVRLRCESVTATDRSCRDVSLEVHGGEIVGLYGLIGAGRSEWAQTVFGLRPCVQGRVWIDGQAVVPRSPGQMARHGLAYVPEDRLHQGLCRGLSLRANAALAALRRLALGPFVLPWREEHLTKSVIDRLRVRAFSSNQSAGTLSGGNQQKVVLGRWLECDPGVLLLDEPTRGVDIGAKAEIHTLMRMLANEGKAVVLISSEMPEVLSNCDRVGVFRDGALVQIFERGAKAEEVAKAALPADSSQEGEQPDEKQADLSSRLRSRLGLPRESALLVLIGMVMFSLEWRTGRFFTASNIGDLATDTVLLGCVAAGTALVTLARGIDISLGALMALSAAVAGKLWQKELPLPAVAAVAVLVGTVGGAINAGLTLLGRVHPIVVTLGTMSVFRGLTLWWMRENITIAGSARNSLFGEGAVLPPIVWIGVGCFILLGVMLERTLFGRSLFAVGGNPAAARRVGISPARVWLKAYSSQGALAGLAGILYLARSGGLQPTSYEEKTLEAISAAVVGGVAITGGRGSIFGVLLGCWLLVLLTAACQFLHISTDWQRAVVGAVLVVAVAADALWRRRRS